MIINSKYGEVLIYAQTVEQEAISQIIEMANSPLGENAHIRIMPDCHAGAGCVIGTTMAITDKVCPNLVGVDIGCGVDLVKTDVDFSARLEELDAFIRARIPYGMDTHKYEKKWRFQDLLCWENLDDETKWRARTSLGTLGGGNHFLEAYAGGWLSVHSGSRNIGYKVAEYYQRLAERRKKEKNVRLRNEEMANIPPKERETWIAARQIKVSKELCYLTGADMQAYLHDVKVMQAFANDNRQAMLSAIVKGLGGKVLEHIQSVHNYIDVEQKILRKGAISAKGGEILVIPLNMRDGILLCKGKGNAEWNYSAPHGAGRLYSRSKAKELFSVEEYREQMQGIYTTCVDESTLDEAPFVYKNYGEITACIQPTVEILDRFLPIYNFKAGG